MAYTQTAVDVFAPTDASGVARRVDNDEVQIWGTEIEAAISEIVHTVINGIVVGNSVVYSLKSGLLANTTRPDGSLGIVFADPVPDNNGVFVESGAGIWTKTNLALPSTFAADLATAIAGIDDLESSKLNATLSAVSTLFGTALGKASPADTDKIALFDSDASGALKLPTWADFKAALKTHFDTFYPSGSDVETAISDAIASLVTSSQVSDAIEDAFGSISEAASAAAAQATVLIGQAYERPGDAKLLYSSTLTGAAATRPPLSIGTIVNDTELGSVLQISSADVTGASVDIAPRIDFAINPDRSYLVLCVLKRTTDALDPLGNGVETRWQSLNYNKNHVGNGVLGTPLNPTIAAGTIRVSYLIGQAGAPGDLDYVIPPSAVYGLPLLRIFGSDHVTVVATIDIRDVTDQINGGADITQITDDLAAEIAAREALDAGLAAEVEARESLEEVVTIGFEQTTLAIDNIEDALDERALGATIDSQPANIPLIVSNDRVVAWLDGGNFAAKGLSEFLQMSIVDRMTTTSNSDIAIPLITADGQVILWLTPEGDLASKGLSRPLAKSAVDLVTTEVKAATYVPLITANGKVILWLTPNGSLSGPGLSANEPRPSRLASDGRTLHRAKAKTALIKTNPGGSDRLRIALMGDSWSDLRTIPNALRDLMTGTIGLAGHGWQDVEGITQIGGVTFAKNGWTFVDATTNVPIWPNGVGIDGKLITATSTTATISIGNLVATEVRIYSFAHGGTWRYQVDGGAWTTVNEASDGALRVTTISGLVNNAHALAIDTTGNTGTVSIGGFYSTGSGAGAEILKAGNASIDGSQMLTYLGQIGPQLADLAPDVLICILGTNDSHRPLSPPDVFIEAIAALAAAARSAVSDIGLIMIAPSLSSPIGLITPIEEYSDALDTWCAANDVEFLSLTRQMGTWAETQPLGMWNDLAHHSAVGARAITDIINENFFKLR
ncbi:SGNH/GDSL hydrolase family protein [Pararhizobium gei]|uniref:SGNH/GDSL hydrolase family protein n=1 Tax=Pararhizobium gei TaxID=1395951 RepID=UPI0023DC0338|nr:SGNH/GDSL hydrolase family protein [Rhizobium gei]